MTAAPDRSLERYEIVDRVAVGGMAEVFRAKAFGAHGFEKSLAIKRILPDFAKDPEFEERFIQEAKLAVQLAHANIVQVFDFGRFDGSLFIAMEYVEGLDLAALLRVLKERDEHVAIGAALHICTELCKGLDYAHRRGVVHRDVSPSNILLSRSGEVKIADFGIAQAEMDAGERPQRRIMGKWRYMSPEQALGETLVPASDLFSAGAVMHEVFTGHKLFPGDEAEQVLDNIRHMPIPKVTELRPQLPPRLDELLAHVLQRDIGERPERAAVIQRALTEISYDSSIVASALDVADTVGEVIGEVEAVLVSAGGGKRGIDDLIRQQIGGKGGLETEPTELADRFTEQANMAHTQTFVRKGVDPDGSTLWESDAKTATIAAVPSAIRGERSGRATGRTPSMDAGAEDSAAAAGGVGIGKLVAAIAAVLVIGGGAAFFALRGDDEPAVAPVVAGDAGAPVVVSTNDAGALMGTLDIRTKPPGVRIRINGDLIDDVTPAMVDVPTSDVATVVLEHDDFRTAEFPNVQTVAGKDSLIRHEMVPKAATLIVKSRPPGADVYLNGDLVGKTPLEKTDVKPLHGMQLVLKKTDYKTVTRRIDLDDREEKPLFIPLESTIEYGKVRIAVSGATNWAYVYYKNKRVGRTPADREFELPVGTQRVRLVNDKKGLEKTVTVTVYKDRVEFYAFEF